MIAAARYAGTIPCLIALVVVVVLWRRTKPKPAPRPTFQEALRAQAARPVEPLPDYDEVDGYAEMRDRVNAAFFDYEDDCR